MFYAFTIIMFHPKLFNSCYKMVHLIVCNHIIIFNFFLSFSVIWKWNDLQCKVRTEGCVEMCGVAMGNFGGGNKMRKAFEIIIVEI